MRVRSECNGIVHLGPEGILTKPSSAPRLAGPVQKSVVQLHLN